MARARNIVCRSGNESIASRQELWPIGPGKIALPIALGLTQMDAPCEQDAGHCFCPNPAARDGVQWSDGFWEPDIAAPGTRSGAEAKTGPSGDDSSFGIYCRPDSVATNNSLGRIGAPSATSYDRGLIARGRKQTGSRNSQRACLLPCQSIAAK